MRSFFTIILAFFLAQSASAENPPVLSSEAEVSLLTCSPGAELYSLFGHSAIRVEDPENGFDVVFNYGTFSYDEDFYFNFAMGKLNYKLGLSPFERFITGYEYEGRGIVQQTLNLDSTQKQAVFNFLDWNREPDNRYYLYDFFYDNCSSVLRDVLDTSLNNSVEWKDLSEASSPTYRNLIDRYLIYDPWGDFGIDLGLGIPCDKVPSYIEYMFLPDKLKEAFDHASINDKPLVKSETRILEEKGLTATWSITQPIPLFWLFFGLIAVISAIGFRKQKHLIAIDIVLFIIYGAVGALLFFLWFITDHTATVGNLNILWAWPVHILAIPILFKPSLRKRYFTVYGIVLLITLIAFPILPQMLHLATIPLMLLMIVRSFVHWRLP